MTAAVAIALAGVAHADFANDFSRHRETSRARWVARLVGVKELMSATKMNLKRIERVLVSVLLVFFGTLLLGPRADKEPESVTVFFSRTGLTVAGIAAFVLATRRHPAIGLAVGTYFAVVVSNPGLSVENVVIAVLGTLAVGFLGLRQRLQYTLLLMSLPWWAALAAVPGDWSGYLALGFVYLGLLIVILRPFISGRRPGLRVEPNPRLAHGPLIEVAPRTFGFTRGRTVVRVLALLTTFACVVGLVIWPTVNAFAGACIAGISASLAVSLWITDYVNRAMRFRVDGDGVYARVFVGGDKLIRWSEIGELSTKMMAMPAVAGGRNRYFCILGGGREITFPESMPAADQLAATVAAATGMTWA